MGDKIRDVALHDLGPGIRRDERIEWSDASQPLVDPTDPFTPEQRSAVMRAVPAEGSSAELKVRKLLTTMGLRYRLHRRDLPGSPDVVMASRKLAVFVHGCFWHGHECVRGARVPKANRDYWLAKVARNRARDIRVQDELAGLGWRPEVVWECELKAPDVLSARLARLVNPA